VTDHPAHPPEVSYRQAVEQVLGLLSGQWVVAILTALGAGSLRSAQLLAEVNAVEEQVGRRIHDVPLSRAVMARTVQRMASAGLLLRHEETESPHPFVWYELTETGQSLLRALLPLAEWAQRYRDDQPMAP
jgi:DNA-binding HxlR family transcriptional regulator